MKILWYYV